MTRSWGDWAPWVAVVPMRTQPLHLAHVNVVANLAERFATVRVVVGNQPRSIDDPFSFAQRLRWWRASAQIHHLDGVEFVPGAHGCSDDERVQRYVGDLPSSHVAIVSGNHEVAEFWTGRGVTILDSCRLPLRDLVGGDTQLRRSDGLGRRLRAALGRGDGDRLVRPLVPPWVWDDLRRTP